jgi:hypothetical protein
MMNRIHLEAPRPDGECFVYRLPAWLVQLLRVGSGIAGSATAFLAAQNWSAMPLPVRILCAFLAAGFCIVAINRRILDPRTHFVADEQGIYFSGQDKWLLVPWPNISDIRVVEIMDGESSTGIAFNLRLSPQEQSEFFQKHLKPADHFRAGSEQLAVGYTYFPPRPKALAATLLGLKHKKRQELPFTLG